MPIIQREDYLELFEEKKNSFLRAFVDETPIDFFKSPDNGYRYRAEFGLLKEKDEYFYSMTKDGKRVAVSSFPISSQKIQNIMPLLLTQIQNNPIISHKLFQVEFQSSRNDDAMVSLIYHKELGDEWSKMASNISDELNISIIGRSKNRKIIIGNNYVTETYQYQDKKFSIKLYEQCFSQTNPFICDSMLSWVIGNIQSFENDLMELHCGLGTFTIPLSRYFNKVLATENSRPSIQALHENVKLNNIENVYTGRLSGKETIEAFKGVRIFRRLKDIDLEQFEIDSIFLDPPREGLDSFTLENIIGIKNIIYISCSFDSFKRDIQALKATHDILKLAMFDQFPYTEHIESGAILRKKY